MLLNKYLTWLVYVWQPQKGQVNSMRRSYQQHASPKFVWTQRRESWSSPRLELREYPGNRSPWIKKCFGLVFQGSQIFLITLAVIPVHMQELLASESLLPGPFPRIPSKLPENSLPTETTLPDVDSHILWLKLHFFTNLGGGGSCHIPCHRSVLRVFFGDSRGKG